MVSELVRDFRAGDKREAAIWDRIQEFIAQNGAEALGSEIAGEIGHITANAWIVNAETSAVLLVFGRKSGRWQLPGAHCDSDPMETAKLEAARALGREIETQNPRLWALGERAILEYWQTPAHVHFELIFRFDENEISDLPRGARWFSGDEVARLSDPILIRLMRKSRWQP